MESKIRKIISFLLLIIIIYSLNTTSSKFQQKQLKVIAVINCFNNLENGDLIFRYGKGVFSKYFRDVSDIERKYSHVGIIYIDLDSIFVIHAEADDNTGLGSVIKEDINKFVQNAHFYDCYRYEGQEKERNEIANYSNLYAINKVPFDTKFDISDTTAFYCTELIAASINKAKKHLYIKPNKILNGKQILTLDHIYCNYSFYKI